MKYFTIKELVRSSVANEKGINNTPNKEARENLVKLVNYVLDPLREEWGKPIYVNSGYRCKKLNKLVGGVENSEHITGNAADIDTHDINQNKDLFELAIKMQLPFRQIILEDGGRWIHISYNAYNIKREVLYT